MVNFTDPDASMAGDMINSRCGESRKGSALLVVAVVGRLLQTDFHPDKL
jgi:hypothetical protein